MVGRGPQPGSTDFAEPKSVARKVGATPPPKWWDSKKHGEWACADIPGFCKAATIEEIGKHGFVLTPGRYVGAEEQEDDGEPFAYRFSRLLI
jgi:type I restriction enzyme M protein